MALRLTPRDTTFFDLFTTLAQYSVQGAGLLALMLPADPAARKQAHGQFVSLEHAADTSAAAVMKRINQTFVTPFDRDDIYDLASALDDTVDSMEEAADLMVLYRLGELPPRVGEIVQVLQRCAELTAAAMPRLRDPGSLEDYWKEISRLEHQGDQLHRAMLAQLFDEVTDPILLIKLKGIIDLLEDACDAFEEVADVVETIALKES